MATLVPDKMPSGSSAAERRFFDLLVHLPDEVFAAYEPMISQRKPDFVVVIPSVGVVVVEIKGLRISDILQIDNHEMTYVFRGNQKRGKHPGRQADDYMRLLMTDCESSLFSKELLHQGRFNVAFGSVVILSEIERSEVDSRLLAHFFPPGQTVCRDELPESGDVDSLLKLFRAAIDPLIPIRRLERRQVDALRYVLHPELTVSRDAKDLRWLDEEQAKIATGIGSGHRIITGVPGSGKTIMLLARAKLAAKEGKKVLLLCYNLRVRLESHVQRAMRRSRMMAEAA